MWTRELSVICAHGSCVRAGSIIHSPNGGSMLAQHWTAIGWVHLCHGGSHTNWRLRESKCLMLIPVWFCCVGMGVSLIFLDWPPVHRHLRLKGSYLPSGRYDPLSLRWRHVVDFTLSIPLVALHLQHHLGHSGFLEHLFSWEYFMSPAASVCVLFLSGVTSW